MGSVFAAAISALVPLEFLSEMVWTISINGVSTSPSGSTFLVFGDPESYFYADSTSVQVQQG